MFIFNKIYRYTYLKNLFKYKIKLYRPSLYKLYYIKWNKMNKLFVKNIFKKIFLTIIFNKIFLKKFLKDIIK